MIRVSQICRRPSISSISTKTTLRQENRAIGRLDKIKSTSIVRTIHPGSRPYICCDTLDRTFGLEIVYLLRGFQGEPHFTQSSYSPNQILRLLNGFLRSPNPK
jgi:hypothetical protein